MAITLVELKKHVAHALDYTSSINSHGALDTDDIINLAGESFYNSRPWNFRLAPPTKLHFTGPITVSGGTWTESTKNLLATGAFASYTKIAGDEINITAGTGATTGDYYISSRTDDDNIVLTESIGASADGQTDIAGTISFPYVAMPSDFSQLLHAQATNTQSYGFQLTTPEHLTNLRNTGISVASYHYYGALVQPTDMSVARLEIYPTPTATLRNILTIVYKTKWDTLGTTSNTPSYADAALVEYVRAFAIGYAENDFSGATAKLAGVMQGTIYQAAVTTDGQQQAHYGPVRNGAISMVRRQSGVNFRPSLTVADPS